MVHGQAKYSSTSVNRNRPRASTDCNPTTFSPVTKWYGPCYINVLECDQLKRKCGCLRGNVSKLPAISLPRPLLF